MEIRYTLGVRLGALTFDPTSRTRAAFWTHRPGRRPAAGQVMAAAPLAATWPGALAVPYGDSVVAMGLKLELLPTGYGPGGSAALLAEGGRRTLIVGPTTIRLEPRHADRLVLFAPDPPRPPTDWLETAASGAAPRLVVPDGAAAHAVSASLQARGVAHRHPEWLTSTARPARSAQVTLATTGEGLLVDARPQADEAWLAAYAAQVDPELCWVHGPRAEALAAALAVAGLSTRVLHAPRQLAFAALPGAHTPWPLGPDP